MMRQILDGKADMETFDNMVELAQMIQDTADCAIDMRRLISYYRVWNYLHDEYMSHIESHRCKEEIGQNKHYVSPIALQMDIPDILR